MKGYSWGETPETSVGVAEERARKLQRESLRNKSTKESGRWRGQWWKKVQVTESFLEVPSLRRFYKSSGFFGWNFPALLLLMLIDGRDKWFYILTCASLRFNNHTTNWSKMLISVPGGYQSHGLITFGLEHRTVNAKLRRDYYNRQCPKLAM